MASFGDKNVVFSRPKTYDPELARKAQEEQYKRQQMQRMGVNDRIANEQRKSLKQELGFSDSDGESYNSDGSESESDDETPETIFRVEYELLQQRYMSAIKDVHSMGGRERKAVESLSKMKQLSKSQALIVRQNFLRKLEDRDNLIAELIEDIKNSKEKNSISEINVQEIEQLHTQHKHEVQQLSSAAQSEGKEVQINGKEDNKEVETHVLKEQITSLSDENSILRKCIADLSSGELAMKEPETAAVPESSTTDEEGEHDNSSNNVKHSGSIHSQNERSDDNDDVSSEDKEKDAKYIAMREKLVKAVKVAKAAKLRLAVANNEKEDLLKLLAEAHTELENRSSKPGTHGSEIEINAVPPPTAPQPGTTSSISSSSNEKIKKKFEKMKKRLQEAENERDKAIELVRELAEQKEANKSKETSNEHVSNEIVEQLEAKLEMVTKHLADAKIQSENDKKARTEILQQTNKAHSNIHHQLSILQSKVGTEKKKFKNLQENTRQEMALFKSIIEKSSNALQRRIKKESNSLRDIVQKYERESRERKRLFNVIQDLRGNVRVYCRVRPPLGKELESKTDDIDSEYNDVVVKFPQEDAIEVMNKNGRAKTWEFDKVFQPKTTNSDVFAQVSDLCTSTLDGYNVCIFAYGQTGSGKTHTMEGNKNDRGVNYRALEKLFSDIHSNSETGEWEYQVSVSFLEIYNEEIKDLLCVNEKTGRSVSQKNKLEVKKGEHGMYVPGLTIIPVNSHEEVKQLMKLGHSNRSTACTDMNAHSSRSHSMLSTYVVARNCITHETARGKMHLIDLAGSERLNKSGAVGLRKTEAANINKSLSALGDVIQARANKNGHVPYRNSTLTYLLQDSLSHDSKTLMFVQISPIKGNSDESSCSLNFASRVRKVELGKAKKNVSR